MHFRQKLAYMALGGGLVLAGHVLPGLVVGPATAPSGLQDAEFSPLAYMETLAAAGHTPTNHRLIPASAPSLCAG